jgi:phosphonate transport system substrate-binding protein
LLLIAASGACNRTEKALAEKKPAAPPPAPQASLLIGLIPEQNIFRQMERYGPLARYVSKKAGVNIRLTMLLRYGNIIDNFTSEGMDGAFFGSFTYALAHAKLGVQVVARPEDPNGRSTYHGLIFVRKDSGIKSVRDMRDRRFVFVDKATTAGYLLPLACFRKNGIQDYKTYLREGYFAGTHENAIQDVLNRKADMGAAKNTVFERIAATDGRIEKDLVVLERSPEVPENALAVRKGLDPALVEKIRAALLAMHEDPEGSALLKTFGARRFIETSDGDYRPVYAYAREIGLDLATYDFMND